MKNYWQTNSLNVIVQITQWFFSILNYPKKDPILQKLADEDEINGLY